MFCLRLVVFVLTIADSVHSDSAFNHLPEEIHVHICNYLSTVDVLRSLMMLNNHTYHNYFLTKYQDEIKIIKEIECMINIRMHQLINMNMLFHQIRKVQLNELYALKLPLLLKKVEIRHMNHAKVLVAMNIRTMPRNQFDSMPFNDTLKLLIYASRNLAPFSFTEKSINDWHFSLKGDTTLRLLYVIWTQK